ncbi:YwqG family protein [Aquimarina sp. 2304DJ70-9]|uniref:YwqG family protein n=1 Tax=Aquimarina penaris TaxID=3231044 RepID=UPI003461B64D
MFLQDQLQIVGLEGIWKKIEPNLKRSIKLKPKICSIKNSLSIIGGTPVATNGFKWPLNLDGEHLSFIAQINLEDITPLDRRGVLPGHGMLYFFYDAFYQPSGYKNEHQNSWKVIYEEIKPLKMVKTPYPQDLLIRNNQITSVFEKLIFHEFEIDFHSEYTVPPYESEFVKSLHLDFDDLWKYEQFYFKQVNQKPRYRMLGFPDRKMVNTDMIAICRLTGNDMDHYPLGNSGYNLPEPIDKNEEWILLLQMDSDLEVGMAWGGEEMGRIYFWIRKLDLLQKNFDRCWVILEV